MLDDDSMRIMTMTVGEFEKKLADVRAEVRKAFAQEVEALLRKHLQHGGDKVHAQLAIVEVDALVRTELEP